MHPGLAYPRATILATLTGSSVNQNMNALLGTKSFLTDNFFFLSGTATSASTGSYALVSGTNYSGPTTGGGSWLRLINSGLIVGAGGAGGQGGYCTATLAANNGQAGGAGGPAFQAQRAISITNTSGRIYGGAGGGGGGGGRASIPGLSGQVIGGAGGGGGGGGGYYPGGGGGGGTGYISNDSFPAPPPPGTWTFAQASSGVTASGTVGGAGGANTQCIYGTGGVGGAGGNAGAAGAHGGDGAGGVGSLQGTGGNGGAAGQYINGTSLVTWVSTGDVRGGAA